MDYYKLYEEYTETFSRLYERYKDKIRDDSQAYAMWIGGKTIRSMKKKYPKVGDECWERINEKHGFGFSTINLQAAIDAAEKE